MKITISNDTYRMLGKASGPRGVLSEPGVQQADGSWQIELSDKTYNKLKRMQLPGESESACLLRGLNIMLKSVSADTKNSGEGNSRSYAVKDILH